VILVGCHCWNKFANFSLWPADRKSARCQSETICRFHESPGRSANGEKMLRAQPTSPKRTTPSPTALAPCSRGSTKDEESPDELLRGLRQRVEASFAAVHFYPNYTRTRDSGPRLTWNVATKLKDTVEPRFTCDPATVPSLAERGKLHLTESWAWSNTLR
jgi:hypothetical protein